MIKNIFRTVVSRIIAALLTFGVVFITSRSLGPENYGAIGLIMVAISISMMFSAFIGGASFVYFTPRINPSILFSISSIWGALMSLVFSYGMAYFSLYPKEYLVYVFLISLIANISHNLMSIIVGKGRIWQQNLVLLIQVFIHFCLISVIFHGFKQQSISNYLTSSLISHIFASIISLIFCRKDIFPLTLKGSSTVIVRIMQYGFWTQLSSFIQLFNYRLSFYLVDIFLGRQFLGIYTLAVQLAESFWILPRSIAIVQYSHISNSSDNETSASISFKLMQFVMIFILFFSIPIIFIPESWFLFVFGHGFEGIKLTLVALIPAIIIFSGVIIIGHYFSGIGKVYFNSIVSGFGLIITIIFGLLLIPNFEMVGAALSAVISYFAMFIISLVIFVKNNKTRLGKYFSEGINFSMIFNLIKNFK